LKGTSATIPKPSSATESAPTAMRITSNLNSIGCRRAVDSRHLTVRGWKNRRQESSWSQCWPLAAMTLAASTVEIAVPKAFWSAAAKLPLCPRWSHRRARAGRNLNEKRRRAAARKAGFARIEGANIKPQPRIPPLVAAPQREARRFSPRTRCLCSENKPVFRQSPEVRRDFGVFSFFGVTRSVMTDCGECFPSLAV
jgi:hypothetical protein